VTVRRRRSGTVQFDTAEEFLASLKEHEHDAEFSRVTCRVCDGMHPYCAICGKQVGGCG
jgi:hypothetical protein